MYFFYILKLKSFPMFKSLDKSRENYISCYITKFFFDFVKNLSIVKIIYLSCKLNGEGRRHGLEIILVPKVA